MESVPAELAETITAQDRAAIARHWKWQRGLWDQTPTWRELGVDMPEVPQPSLTLSGYRTIRCPEGCLPCPRCLRFIPKDSKECAGCGEELPVSG